MARFRCPSAIIVAGVLVATLSSCGSGSQTAPPPPTILAFALSRSTITTGDPVTLSWTVSGATSISIDNGVGAVTGSSTSVKPTASTTYTLTATGSSGMTATASATVTVVPAVTISEFTATPSNLYSGDSATLNWIVSGATALSIDNGVGTVTGATTTVKPAATTTYTLTATNAAGASATAQTAVTVITGPPSISSFVASPAVLTPVSTGIDTTDLQWSTSQAASLAIDNGVGTVTGSQVSVTPGGATTYTLTASNKFPPNATAKASVGVWSKLTLLAGALGGIGNLDGPSPQAYFSSPYGTAVGIHGEVYVADTTNSTIRKIVGGQVTTFAGKPGVNGSADGPASAATFNQPVGIAADTVGNLFIADSLNNTIRKIDSTGSVTTIAGMAGVSGHSDGTGQSASFDYPIAVAVDALGNVYVSDSKNNIIRKITPVGAVTTFAGTAGVAGSSDGTSSAASFSSPAGLAFDADRNLYVADLGNATIRKISPAGVVTTFAGTAGLGGTSDGTGPAASFFGPYGLAFDTAGNLFVSDEYNFNIRKISPSASVTTFAGMAGVQGNSDGIGTNATFRYPTGLSADSQGNLYVANTSNSNIRMITASAVVSTFAGINRGDGPDYVDGIGANARFAYMSALSVDRFGNVYVADEPNEAIRKVTPQGVVSTLAGGPQSAAFANPLATAADGAGNVYFAADYAIYKIAPDGTLTILAGNPSQPGFADGTGSAARFSSPYNLAIDFDGNVFVADLGNCVIRKITPSGIVSTFAGNPGHPGENDGAGNRASFDGPGALSFDQKGNLYVIDTFDFSPNPNYTNPGIRKVTPQGMVSTLYRGPDTPNVIASDPAGNLYGVYYSDYTVKMFSPQRSPVTLIGTAGIDGTMLGTLPGSLGNPLGIAITPDGNLVMIVSEAVVTLSP